MLSECVCYSRRFFSQYYVFEIYPCSQVNLFFVAIWIVWKSSNLLFILLTKDTAAMDIFMHIFYGKYVQEFLLGIYSA